MADHQCVICTDFSTSDQELMRRHVAIVHGESAFSTLQCEVCERKYYDFDHFKDHIREMPACSSEGLKITPVPLTQNLDDAFASLVDQIMKPSQVQSTQFPLTDGQSSLASQGNTSPNQVPLQMKGTGDSGIPKIISVTSLADHQSSMMDTQNGGQSKRSVEMAMETNMQDHGSVSNSTSPLTSTIVGRLRRRTSLVNTDGPISNGPSIKRPFIGQRMLRNAIGCRSSMTLEKDNTGTKFETVGASKLSKVLQESLSNGSNAIIKQSSVLPAHLRAQKEICSEKVKKYVKDGQLECKLCHQRISVSRNNSDFGRIRRAYDHAMMHIRDVDLFECTNCDYRTSSISSMYLHVQQKHSLDQRKFIDHSTEHYPKILQMLLDCFSGEKSVDGHQETTVTRKPRQTTPAHIVDARRACYEKVKDFMENGKLYCQLCSKWILVEYPGSSNVGVGYSMVHAIAHAITHVEGCDLFECSNCHITKKNKRTMFDHAKRCQKEGQGKFIDRSNQYYREILDQFMACFDLKNTGKSLEATQTTGAGNGNGNGTGKESEKMGEASSALNPMNSTSDTTNYSVCTKCGYKTAFKMIFQRHLKIMHGEVDMSQAHEQFQDQEK